MLSAAFIMTCHMHCTPHLEEDTVILIIQIYFFKYNYDFVQFLPIFTAAISGQDCPGIILCTKNCHLKVKMIIFFRYFNHKAIHK